MLHSKHNKNKNKKNQIKLDELEFSSTDDAIVRSSNNSANGENSKLNNIFC